MKRYYALIWNQKGETRFKESFNQTPEQFLEYIRYMFPKTEWSVKIIEKTESIIND